MRRVESLRPMPSVRIAAPRLSRRTVAGALVALALLVPGALWLRDSSLVAVSHVQITGATGADGEQVRQAITDAAHGMSTLHLDPSRITAAVQPFPIVESVEVRGALPHTLKVVVHEHVPVGALSLGARREAVASDGTVLSDTSPVGLPLVPVKSPPGGKRLAERNALRLVALLGAAPAALRSHVARVGLGPHGLTAWLVEGPPLYFGPGTRLRAKWLAAATVLADPSSHGARYIDLRVPEQPAAGGLEPLNAQPEVQAGP
jgi:cell division protein FtsQ